MIRAAVLLTVSVTVRDGLTFLGLVLTFAGTYLASRRAGISSDRAQRVAVQSKRDEVLLAANSAENSGYTRAQEMVAEAAKTQKDTFDTALTRLDKQIERLQLQVDTQARRLEEQAAQLLQQHSQIGNLQQSRESDRRTYRRYIEKLLALLQRHQIEYPTPPPFFDDDPTI